MSRACQYLLTTQAQVKDGCLQQAIATWQQLADPEAQIYLSEASGCIIELARINKSAFQSIIEDERHNAVRRAVAPWLRSDMKRELLSLSESVVQQSDVLPQSKYLQMRHIEVPLSVYQDYLVWREKTIFGYVRDLPNVESFVAYHSVFSTQPGVMFVCGFSCDPASYAANFTTDAYLDIVKQAGNQFIAGGEQGLYTSLYQRYRGKDV